MYALVWNSHTALNKNGAPSHATNRAWSLCETPWLNTQNRLRQGQDSLVETGRGTGKWDSGSNSVADYMAFDMLCNSLKPCFPPRGFVWV